MLRRDWRWWLPAVLLVGALLTPLTGAGDLVQASSVVVPALLGAGAGLARLRHRPARQRPAWVLHAAGMLLLAAGYLLFHLWLGGVPVPAWGADALFLTADAVVLGAYVRLMAGHRDPGAGLDAGIAVTGLGVVVATFLVRPLVEAQAGVVPAVLNVVYPLHDLVALGLVVRWWLSGQGERWTAALFAGSAACLLVGDTTYGVLAAVAPPAVAPWFGFPFSAALCLQAAAVLRPVAEDPGFARRRHRPVAWSRVRWVLVVVAACLAPGVLLVQGLAGVEVDWQVTGTGALLLTVLTLSRLHLAVATVQRQAAVLGELARTDGLTGLPNRRTWDGELDRALARALPRSRAGADGGGPVVSVALLDLDHFKRVNDTEGHAAGDQVLRDVAAAWRAALPAEAVLARYGGEEFAVLLLAASPAEAVEVLERVRRSTPAPRTVSVGVAHRVPGETADLLTARADAALYRAKGAGRDRVCAAAP